MSRGNLTMPKTILLDTHTWIWLNEGVVDKFSESVIKCIEKSFLEKQLLVSSISIWEIGMLTSKGRLTFADSCQEWINKALKMSGITLIQLEPSIALHSSYLVGDFHADPADRIIVATAQKKNATLLTADKKILEYGSKGYLKVLSLNS